MTNAKEIQAKAFADVEFEPFPHNYRHILRTRIVIFDTIPKKYLCKKICDLDFWNEISGFIHSNYNYGHKVVDATDGNVEIPDDVSVIHQALDDSYIPIVAGDYFINSNYEVFRCYGWKMETEVQKFISTSFNLNRGNSRVYFFLNLLIIIYYIYV